MINTILEISAQCWNERLYHCIKSNGYTQKSFAKAFKEKYGKGTQAHVNRWLRVGNYSAAQGKTIGFPSYENMKLIADFFSVPVGYLTGETDFKSFDMERACSYLGITEEAGSVIEKLATGRRSGDFIRFLSKNYGASFNYLVTAKEFTLFIEYLNHIAVIKKQINKQINKLETNLKRAIEELDEDTIEKVLPYKEVWRMFAFLEDDEFQQIKDEETDFAPELLNVIRKLGIAEQEDYRLNQKLEQKMKLARFELFEMYSKLIESVICDEHLEALTDQLMTEAHSIEDIKKKITDEKYL